jgi:hypothetical protein
MHEDLSCPGLRPLDLAYFQYLRATRARDYNRPHRPRHANNATKDKPGRAFARPGKAELRMALTDSE